MNFNKNEEEAFFYNNNFMSGKFRYFNKIIPNLT